MLGFYETKKIFHNCNHQCLVKSLQPKQTNKQKCPFAWGNKFPHPNKVFFPSDLAVLFFGLTLSSSILHLTYWSTKRFIACIWDLKKKNCQKLNISNLSNIHCKNLFSNNFLLFSKEDLFLSVTLTPLHIVMFRILGVFHLLLLLRLCRETYV